MGIRPVAVFSDPDRQSLFVAEADEAVALGGSTPGESYLRIDAILDAARRVGADAIHPGYGFLSENAEFARACQQAGIKLIGPTPEAIAAMGSKIEAKRRMQAAGVPVLPSVDVAKQSPAELARLIDEFGWPALIKASAGGGGRGMRVVRDKQELAAALEGARRESASAFGDDTVFIEPYLQSPRHIEFQIFGDSQGNVVHLFERECSIQRRHQKIVEEAPSVALDSELREQMGRAAVAAGKAIGYQNAGTVEFIFTPERKFYFLEVNTRLQVEHPVTEEITGLDLVRLQIEVAAGAPLPKRALKPAIEGHAIEVRLYAEDPRRDFMPVSGKLDCFEIPELPGIRLETGVATGGEVSTYYDPMLAKVIARGATREEAARRLAQSLRRAKIHGLRTNRELLVRLLEHPSFLAGDTDTHFLERHPPAELGRPLIDEAGIRAHALAAALALQAENRRSAPVLARIPSGWRNNPSQPQTIELDHDGQKLAVKYRLQRTGLQAEVDAVDIAAQLESAEARQVAFTIDAVRREFSVARYGDRVAVDSSLGSTEFKLLPRFFSADEAASAGSLSAPMPGVVNEVKVQAGDLVDAGQVLLVIESMKMLYPIAAPIAGRVAEIRVKASAHVEAGVVLAVIEEPSA